MFHDIGNIGVPDRILLKRGSLKSDEWRILQQHTMIGEQVLEHVPLLEGEGLRVVRSHHERWDGTRLPGRARRRATSRSAPGSSRSPTHSTR